LNGSGRLESQDHGAMGDADSASFAMDESGITKTIHVRVVHGRASQVGPG
jgi:hypothetical protein